MPLLTLPGSTKRIKTRRRARRADAGQALSYDVPTHLDDRDVLKWGMTVEQFAQAMAIIGVGLVVFLALLAVVPGPLVGWRLLWALLGAAPLVVVAFPLAKWRPDDQLAAQYLMYCALYRLAPKYADWQPRSTRDVLYPQPVADAEED